MRAKGLPGTVAGGVPPSSALSADRVGSPPTPKISPCPAAQSARGDLRRGARRSTVPGHHLQCSGQGRAVGREQFAEFALRDLAGALQDLQNRELCGRPKGRSASS